MNPYVVEILKKMCEMVNADFTTIDFTESNWFWKYKWNQCQEAEFKKWLFNYLSTNKEARKSIMRHPTTTKTMINKTVDWFIFQYSWKIKTETV